MSEGPPTPAAALAPASPAARVRSVLTRWLRAPQAAAADDWALWRRACGGDAFAATALVQQLTPQALGLARQLLRNVDDAEDMVQESFLRLWQARPSETQGARLATYFNTIVINRCNSLLTRRREMTVETEVLHELADAQAGGTGGDPDGPAHARALGEALLRLPPRQRMALAMWAYADAGAAEIAAALELEPNAAHQLLHRAKQSLRRQWSGG